MAHIPDRYQQPRNIHPQASNPQGKITDYRPGPSETMAESSSGAKGKQLYPILYYTDGSLLVKVRKEINEA